MGLWGWVWWGTSRSQLAKTMIYPSLSQPTHVSERRDVSLNVSVAEPAMVSVDIFFTLLDALFAWGALCYSPEAHKRVGR